MQTISKEEIKRRKVLKKLWRIKKASYLCSPLKRNWASLGKVKVKNRKVLIKQIEFIQVESTSQEVVINEEKR